MVDLCVPYQFSKYHRKVQGTGDGQTYFSRIQYVKIIGEHEEVIGRVKPYLSSSTVRQKYIRNTSSLWSIPSSLLFSLCATSDWEVWFNQERILQSFRLHKACTCYLSCECLLYQELWLPVLQWAQTPVLAQRDTQYSLTARPRHFCSAWGVPYSVSTDAKPKRNREELVIEGSRIWL